MVKNRLLNWLFIISIFAQSFVFGLFVGKMKAEAHTDPAALQVGIFVGVVMNCLLIRIHTRALLILCMMATII